MTDWVAENRSSAWVPGRWRLSARLLVVDPAERVLLVPVRDPVDGREWWETPGGGVDPDESVVAAAVRETREETGYLIDPPVVGPLIWRGAVRYSWLGVRRLSRQMIYRVDLADMPVRVARALVDDELGALGEPRWLSADEVVASPIPVAPFRDLREWHRVFTARELVDSATMDWEPRRWEVSPV